MDKKLLAIDEAIANNKALIEKASVRERPKNVRQGSHDQKKKRH